MVLVCDSYIVSSRNKESDHAVGLCSNAPTARPHSYSPEILTGTFVNRVLARETQQTSQHRSRVTTPVIIASSYEIKMKENMLIIHTFDTVAP
jgi:hypothetical protein